MVGGLEGPHRSASPAPRGMGCWRAMLGVRLVQGLGACIPPAASGGGLQKLWAQLAQKPLERDRNIQGPDPLACLRGAQLPSKDT